MDRLVARAGRALVVAVALSVAGAHAAEPAKVIRVAMSIAETSFDPSFASELRACNARLQ